MCVYVRERERNNIIFKLLVSSNTSNQRHFTTTNCTVIVHLNYCKTQMLKPYIQVSFNNEMLYICVQL